MADIIFPLLIVGVVVYAKIKKVDAYSSFVKGAKGALPLIASIFPYILAMVMAVALFRASGLSGILCTAIAPVFKVLGIPKEVCELILIRPFSSNAAYVLLKDIFTKYGVDTYVGKCASVIMGSSDTVFYISSIYFASTSVKKTLFTIPIALICNLVGAVIACLCCRFI